MGGSGNVQLFVDGKRLDGRTVDQLRPIKIQAGILNNVDGSAYIEWGKNKILAAVYGPRECIPKHDSDPYKAVVRCRYLMAPFSSLEEHGRSGPNRRSQEISDVIKEALENVIITENYPKTAIDTFVEILEGNGSTRVAGLTALSVALVCSGVPIKDIPVAMSVGKINGRVAIDMAKEEDNFGEADLAIAIRPGNKEVILLQMDGKLTRDELVEGFDLIYKAADEIHEIQVAALKSMYESKSFSDDAGAGSLTAESVNDVVELENKFADDTEAEADNLGIAADEPGIVKELPGEEEDLPEV